MVIVLISILTGVVGTGIGSYIGQVLYRQRSRIETRGFIIFASGVIAGLFCFSILPECLKMQSIPVAVLMIVAGALISILVIILYKKLTPQSSNPDNQSLKLNSLILIAAISVHNFPEGVALGTELYRYSSIGLIWAILIALHNIPIGISIGITQSAIGSEIKRIIALAGVSGVPLVLGSLLAVMVGGYADTYPEALLPLAGGAMLAVIIFEIKDLIPGNKMKSLVIPGALGLIIAGVTSLL